MHIAIEGHGFFGEGGSQTRYVYELVRALARVDCRNQYTIFLNSLRGRLPSQDDFSRWLGNANFSYILTRFPNLGSPRLKGLRARFVWPMLGRSRQIGLFHSTAQRIMYEDGMPSVLTIHDLAGSVHPQWFPQTPLAREQNATVVRDIKRTDRIVASSLNTQTDICRVADVESSRVRTVLLGVNTERFSPCKDPHRLDLVRQRHGLIKPYFLHVGDLVPRKNLDRLIRVFAQLKKRRLVEHQLVLAGKRNYGPESIFHLPKELGIEHEVRFLGYVPEADLPALYTQATALVYPSLYEGFGLPLLEAMACGSPVVCSNAGSLAEVVGKAGIVLSATDDAGWLDAMDRLTQDKALCAKLQDCGLKHAQQFSWERTAQMTLEIYRELGAQ